jgi:hypothetical protein
MKTLDALQHLTIPPTVWTQISMYFIVGFPKYGNKVVIMVVLIEFINMLILFPSNTPLDLTWLLKYSWIICSNNMVFPNQFS